MSTVMFEIVEETWFRMLEMSCGPCGKEVAPKFLAYETEGVNLVVQNRFKPPFMKVSLRGGQMHGSDKFSEQAP